MDTQSLEAPVDSISSDFDAKLDRNSFGFGLVARW
jgi:hypothetical protein